MTSLILGIFATISAIITIIVAYVALLYAWRDFVRHKPPTDRFICYNKYCADYNSKTKNHCNMYIPSLTTAKIKELCDKYQDKPIRRS